MKIKTSIKAGGGTWNHNETQVQGAQKPAPQPAPVSSGLKIKTSIKAGGGTWNHNETQRTAG